jgi:squalene cyclase
MAFSNGWGLGYWLYSLERACMIADVKKLGDIDWYKEGAKILVGEQSDNGGWGNTVQYNPRTRQTEKQETGGYVVDTCFALLFLRKAFVGIGIETPSSRGKDSERPKGIETK